MTSDPAHCPLIPYGMADFEAIRAEGRLFVDKTRFIRTLEEHHYVFLIRPRRFGKSLWVSVLEYYYDRTLADRFEALFAGTDIGNNPTPKRSRYVVLRFDFSVFRKDPETLEANFEEYCTDELAATLARNCDLFPEAARRQIGAGSAINGRRHLAAEEETVCDVQDSFPLAELVQPENFASLLHYFGLLSIRGDREGETLLAVPNQSVKHLMYGYLRDGYRDVGVFSVDSYRLSGLVRGMAWRGEWRPAIDFLRDAVASQTGIRDYISGEKVIQGFLAAHLGSSQSYQLHSEHELGKGYADLFLEPFVARYPDIPFGYVIELMYLRRGEPAASGDDALARWATARREEAKAQLAGYLADPRLAARYPSVRFIGIALVFHGWELVARDAVEALPARPARS